MSSTSDIKENLQKNLRPGRYSPVCQGFLDLKKKKKILLEEKGGVSYNGLYLSHLSVNNRTFI